MTLRIAQVENQQLALDLLGPNLWAHWYAPEDPQPRDLERLELVATILGRPLVIQKRLNRGVELGKPAEKWLLRSPESRWQAEEKHPFFTTKYRMALDQGESYGLFLDQRLNRRKLAQMASGKQVLNLFAYTGGFSLAAAQNGAESTTTVDLSGATIEWAKSNFEQNSLSLDNHQFFAADCFFFLDRALKKGRQWDLIVCDPPIFSRSKERTFRIEQDLRELIQLCAQCLKPGGWLLFSTHYSGWTQAGLKKELRSFFKGLILDGELDIDFPGDHPLKSFWLQKLEG